MTALDIWQSFQNSVIKPGNCTHCGACVGLNPHLLKFEHTLKGPLPLIKKELESSDAINLKIAYSVCPGRGVPYPELFKYLNKETQSWLLGPTVGLYQGYATDKIIRRRGASGGVITRVLIYLLESGQIDGAVLLKQGASHPEKAEPIIASSKEDILACAQSIYEVTPMLDILPETKSFNGNLAFVGLPDQVAALRMLQAAEHPSIKNLKYIFGPYTGTNMYKGSIRSFMRAHGISDQVEIQSLKWRAGEWPGYLEVQTKDNQVIRAEKFYYNYLIPFYISQNCLLTPDFSNELTDLSVGDAWSPEFEKARGGHSVIITRNKTINSILLQMESEKELFLEPLKESYALSMHGHMLDFKKRGTFIRLNWKKAFGQPTPEFGYYPENLTFGRIFIERIIAVFLWIGKQDWAHFLIEKLPLWLIGPLFNVLRKNWKRASKPTKRRGLTNQKFILKECTNRWKEIIFQSKSS